MVCRNALANRNAEQTHCEGRDTCYRGPLPAKEITMFQLLPELITDRPDINKAFRLAMSDIHFNIRPYTAGLIDGDPVLCAGLDYPDPWTRDTAINILNGTSLIFPEVTRNNLLATLIESDGAVMLRDAPGSPEPSLNYWDAIIWVLGAWHYYVYTGDDSLLQTALQVAERAFQVFEELEFDPELGLFRGGAVYGDGVAAYPDTYAEPAFAHADIAGWPARNPDRAYPKGTGLPMCSLSTNCVYVEAYRLAARIAREVGDDSHRSWETKADALSDAINREFWTEDKGTYRYLVDPFGGSEHQEGLGLSLAILFGIADEDRASRVLDTAHITPQGIACVWPTFPRYAVDADTFGRHSGTIWPFIQAFWAEAALTQGRKDLFDREFLTLTRLATQSDGFYEIYHPLTGEPYGGVQEGIRWGTWASVPRQTWSATGYLRMVLTGVLGMRFSLDGITFEPSLPDGVHKARLRDLPYRNMVLDITVEGVGDRVTSLTINGEPAESLSADGVGRQEIRIATGE